MQATLFHSLDVPKEHNLKLKSIHKSLVSLCLQQLKPEKLLEFKEQALESITKEEYCQAVAGRDSGNQIFIDTLAGISMMDHITKIVKYAIEGLPFAHSTQLQ